MHNFKMCERCNHVVISNLNSETADYYRHLSVKYCTQCAEIVKKEKARERAKRYRARKKAEKNCIQYEELTQLELLKRENDFLRENYVELVETVEKLRNIIQAEREQCSS